jgi:hypothetical protein
MRRLVLCALLLSGCDVLFPEFSGNKPADGGATDSGGGLPHIAGAICSLGDVRDFSTCGLNPMGSFRVAVEETKDAIQADAAGNYNLPTMGALASATVSVVDATGAFVPTITVVHPTGGVLDNFAIPVVSSNEQQAMALDNGLPVDPTKGTLLAWAVDATGKPMPGIHATAVAGAYGPLYDGNAPGLLVQAQATGTRGLVAQLDVPPGTITLQLTTPTATSTTFMLPIRAGAITVMALTLPSQ